MNNKSFSERLALARAVKAQRQNARSRNKRNEERDDNSAGPSGVVCEMEDVFSSGSQVGPSELKRFEEVMAKRNKKAPKKKSHGRKDVMVVSGAEIEVEKSERIGDNPREELQAVLAEFEKVDDEEQYIDSDGSSVLVGLKRKVPLTPSERIKRYRDKLTPEKREADRKRDTDIKQKSRAEATPEKREADRKRDTEIMEKSRAEATPEKREADRKRDTEIMEKSRAEATPEKREADRKRDTEIMEKSRAEATPEKREADRKRDTEIMEKSRAEATPEKREADRKRDTEIMEKSRAEATPEKNAADRKRDTEIMQKLRAEATPEKNAADRKRDTEIMQKLRAEATTEKRAEDKRKDKVQHKVQRSFDKAWLRKKKAERNLKTADMGIDPQAPKKDYDEAAKKFHLDQSTLEAERCDNCHEKFPDVILNSENHCQKCVTARKGRNGDKFTEANKMHDSRPVPEELKGLWPVEEILISMIVPMMGVYNLPLGQKAYSGNVINFPQEVPDVVTQLPRTADNAGILLFRKEGAEGTYKDFRVRRSKVRDALYWLKDNNKYYSKIKIEEAFLELLPDGEEGGVMDFPCIASELDSLTKKREELMEEMVESASNDRREEDDDDDDAPGIVGTGIPRVIEIRTEKAKKTEALDALLGHAKWPTVSRTPTNEFTTEGYVAMAFPTLFPYGDWDLNVPRDIKIKPQEYFRHLLRYEDPRFARHDRFRYFAFNTMMRHRAIKSGRVFYNRSGDDKNLTIEDLVQMHNRDKNALLKRILRFSSSLPGSRQYWYSRRHELVQMIKQRGLPTIFFTLSAADLQWPDLHRLMPEYESNSRAVNENPLLCDWFFVQRIEKLLHEYMTEELGMVDFWGRFEFQHRGSVHFHGLAWLKDAPDVSKMDLKKCEEDKDTVIKYFENLLSCSNPASEEEQALIRKMKNPASMPYFKIEDHEMDYKGLVNHCHVHLCREGYCKKRVPGRPGPPECRFNFPFKTVEESFIKPVPEKNGTESVQLFLKRNDGRINSHNRKLVTVNRSNTDAQAILDERKVVGYCTKYVTKPEPKSALMKELTSSVSLGKLTEAHPLKQLAQRALIRCVGDRDYSAQEVSHLLMGHKQYLSSRTFVPLYLGDEREIDQFDKEVKLNVVDKYRNRPQKYEALSLFEFYQKYDVTDKNGLEVRQRQKEAIPVPMGLKNVSRESPLFEKFCTNYLKVYKPFREDANLKENFGSWIEAYDDFKRQEARQECNIDEQIDAEDIVREEDEDEHEVDQERRVNDRIPVDYADLLRIDPRFEAVMEMTENHDWTARYRSRPQLYQDVREKMRELRQSRAARVEVDLTDIDVSKMNEEQREVYEEVERHVQSDKVEPLLKIVTGTAGTGKSFLINCLRKLLGNKCVVIGPTGVSACNVDGQTIHCALRIPIKHADFRALTAEALENLQEPLKDAQYIIIDEMSMVSLDLIHKIDRRLSQAFPTRTGSSDEFFGGRSVLLFGDFGQLPPAASRSLFSGPGEGNEYERAGGVAYKQFQSCTRLQTVVRQAEDTSFRDLLLRLRRGEVTREDYLRLQSRVLRSNQQEWDDEVHLYTTRHEVNEHNHEKLIAQNKPVAVINADHGEGGNVAKNATFDDCGLEPTVRLCEGARVMLTANISVGNGLCNGTVGTVEEIVYENGRPPGLPLCIVCRFEGYKGPAFFEDDPKLVPVTPVTYPFVRAGTSCSRTMIPLRLAWAMTVHKAQGLTLPKAVINLGEREFANGLTYVALSRVRRLEDLALHLFSESRLRQINSISKTTKLERLHFLEREDERLDKMARNEPYEDLPDVTARPVQSSAVVPEPPDMDQPGTSDDVQIIGVPQNLIPGESARDVASRLRINFNPLTDQERRTICEEKGFVFYGVTDHYGEQKEISGTADVKRIKKIDGDGNCLYHSIMRGLTGRYSNDDSDVLRGLLYYFAEENPDFMANNMRSEAMRRLAHPDRGRRSWGGTVEIIYAASFLNLSIYVYMPKGTHQHNMYYEWMEHHPFNGPPTEKGLYLFFCLGDQKDPNPNHYVLVLDVEERAELHELG